MKVHVAIVLIVAAQLGFVTLSVAHPGSGIVVDAQGNAFVSDINRGLLKFGPEGKVSVVLKEAGHWLAVDTKKRFEGMDFQKSDHWPRWFKHRNPPGSGLALISDGGSPLVIQLGETAEPHCWAYFQNEPLEHFTFSSSKGYARRVTLPIQALI